MSKPLTILEAVMNAAIRLDPVSTSPRIDAEILLCHVLDCNTAHLVAWPKKPLDIEQALLFEQHITQREKGVPVAYITGTREFWSLELGVTTDTLIPRPETETLVEYVMDHFAKEQSLEVIDLGTGSGAIAIALASERPHWNIIATDISTAALDVALSNARRHNINNIEFMQSDWLQALGNHRFDIIISNPPYVAADDPHLSSGDVRFEPEGALVSGTQGMDDIRTITSQALDHLKPGGCLIIEHGYDQQTLMLDCFTEAGLVNITQLNDLAGLPRMTAGCLQP